MKNLSSILITLALLSSSLCFAQEKFTISGTISDASNGEALIGASVYVPSINNGAVTNVYGYYSISLPAGEYDLSFTSMGYTKKDIHVLLDRDINQDIALVSESKELQEVIVTAEKRDKNVEQVQMSVETMNIETIKKIPAFMGEVDLIKAIQLLPGVQTAGEGSSGMYVRGGNVDQNLILLDEALVYNASHLLGIFSVFNSDAIKDIQLYKGGIPARYGGRLSSVLDIRMKEGNYKKFSATGGIGTVSSRLTLEGPLKKDRGSFIASGRRTYADQFLIFSKDEDIKDSKLFFYDFNLKGNYRINEKNRIFASGYFGRDVAKFGGDFGIGWGNTTGTVRWNHVFGKKLFANFTVLYSDFDYSLGSEESADAFSWESNIRDLSGKLDFDINPNPNNNMKFGYQIIHHHLLPGTVSGGDESIITGLKLDEKFALEHGIYFSNEQRINSRLSLDYGLRYSLFQNMGETREFVYNDLHEVTDTLFHDSGEIYHSQGGLEPRFGMKYTLDEQSSVKASYMRTRQYLQLASNGTTSSPFDIWFAASPRVKGQVADQVAAGYFRNFNDNKIESSIELYYKKADHTIDFKDHAQLFLNQQLEGELRFGESTAYGAEFMVRKKFGKMSGFVSYTLSRVEKDIEGVNNGDTYLAHWDKTHDIAIVASYELNKKWSLGANWIYQSGRAVTAPTGRFTYGNTVIPVYSDRNAVRLPDYHRLDVSATLTPKKSFGKKWKGEWVFSIYNLYGRKNAYSVNFVQDETNPNETYAEKMYLFRLIPSVTYNFKF